MARRPTKREEKPNEHTAAMLEALAFVGMALNDKSDLVHASHCSIAQGQITAFDGVLAAGQSLPFDFSCAPHASDFLTALHRCKTDAALTLTDNGNLLVKSGRFRATINCVPPDALNFAWPDPATWPISDDLRAGFTVLLPLIKESGDRWFESALLLQNGSMLATDGRIMLEYWHAIGLPTLTLPRRAIVALLKINRKLVSLGSSENTATFHFDDGSWLRTQQFVEKYPQVEHILGAASVIEPIPEGLAEGVDAVLPFSAEGKVFFHDGFISSDPDGLVSRYDVPGLKGPQGFTASYLKHVLANGKHGVDFYSDRAVARFFGGDAPHHTRGCIAKLGPGPR